MIICKRLVHQDDHFKRLVDPEDHLQWLVDPNDHLQDARQSRRLFARGCLAWMIICDKSVHRNDHLQESGRSG